MIKNFPLTKKNIITWLPGILAIAGLVILILASFGWWRNIQSDPERVFWGAVENNLRTDSLTRHRTELSDNQHMQQTARLVTGPQNTSFAKTILKQTGQTSAEVVTETIGTPTADYIRYVSIETGQKSQNGGDMDFSSVLNVWGKSEQQKEYGTSGELFNELTLGVIPVGSLDKKARRELLEMAQKEKVYEVDYKQVSKSIDRGRPVYAYKVLIKPDKYVEFLIKFAEKSGLTQLKGVDPSEYSGSSAIEFTVTIDVWSRRVIAIQQVGGLIERFSGHGIKNNISLPKETISTEELQSRIQNIR